MQTLRRFFRQAAGLALVAILALALVPTVSHAVAAAGHSGPWSDICRATMDAGAMPGEPAGTAATHPQHCPLCSLAGTTAIVASAVTDLVVPEGADYVAAPFRPDGASLRLWALAQARAPPLIG